MYNHVTTYQNLSGLNGSLEVQNSAAKVMQISGTISAISASIPGGQAVSAIAGAVAGLSSLVSRIASSGSAVKSAIQQTEAANNELRTQIAQVDAENQKLATLINSNNKSISNFNGLGICLFNCSDKRKLSSVQEQYAHLQKELSDRLATSATLAQRALDTVQRLAGLKTETNILLWGGGIALGLSVVYLGYKIFSS